MSTNIKETRELIKALASLTVRTINNIKDDGKISLAEGLGYLGELGAIKDALNDIGKVPDEVLNLSSTELETLKSDIRQGLIEAGVTHRLADITEQAIKWLHETLSFARFVINAPPTAIPV